jgi:hypothetical protein
LTTEEQTQTLPGVALRLLTPLSNAASPTLRWAGCTMPIQSLTSLKLVIRGWPAGAKKSDSY